MNILIIEDNQSIAEQLIDFLTNQSFIVDYAHNGKLGLNLIREHHYDVVILDEAHERSLFTDVLFTLAKQAVYKRRGGLRLIITSATLDTELFSCFLHKCPVIAVSGRCFPVVVSHVGDIPEALRVEQCVKASINIHLQE